MCIADYEDDWDRFEDDAVNNGYEGDVERFAEDLMNEEEE
jgi:hypothetical protein